MQKIVKGVKTSEFYVVLLLIGSQLFGVDTIDIDTVLTQFTTTSEQVNEIARQLHDSTGGDLDNVVWVALAFVVGRMLLKWKELNIRRQE